MSERVSRRTLIGATAAIGATPLVVPIVASAREPAQTVAAPPPGPPAPPLIDPALELSPADPPLAPWQRPRLSPERARTLVPRRRSTPGDAAAGRAAAAAALPFSFATYDFEVRELPVELKPYYLARALPVEDRGAHDALGVRMFRKDGVLYNHPVAQAQYGLSLLESYRITGDTVFLDRARQHGQRFWNTRVVRSNAWFYPYRFPFRLHATAAPYNPPWYSMMAQGQVLSFLTRLYAVTGNENWATAAHNTFNSFKLAPAVGQPWGVYVVNGRLVFEEYPDPTRIRGDLTYNGHTFAIYGLHDYWSWTKDADALALMRGGMTTVRDWSASYRQSGFRSKYCLTHAADAGKYHAIHLEQFAQLYAITGDEAFAGFVDSYYDDSPPDGGGKVQLNAGGHTACTFDVNGKVTSRKTLRLNATSSAPSSHRQRVWRQPGLWYTISAGGLAGYRLQENPPTRYQLGLYAGATYLLHRPATIKAAAPNAYEVDASGKASPVITEFQVGEQVTVDARGVLNAAQHVRLAEGAHAGRWLPLAAVTLGGTPL